MKTITFAAVFMVSVSVFAQPKYVGRFYGDGAGVSNVTASAGSGATNVGAAFTDNGLIAGAGGNGIKNAANATVPILNAGKVYSKTNNAGRIAVDFGNDFQTLLSLTNVTLVGVISKEPSGTNCNWTTYQFGNISSSNITFTFSGGFTNRGATNGTIGNVITLGSQKTAEVKFGFQEGQTTNWWATVQP